MASPMLTRHDLGVLDKIKDPESGTSAPVLIDDALPRDPHIQDREVYQRAVMLEKQVIMRMQQLELRASKMRNTSAANLRAISGPYLQSVESLSDLIRRHGNYASARNNRAQALRRLYGDRMLVGSTTTTDSDNGLLGGATEEEVAHAATTCMSDLDTAVQLLSPATPFAAVSPQAARTLAQAYTQRGALYHAAAKEMARGTGMLRLNSTATQTDLEEQASKNFAMGGRYGNEIGRALAVATNPTAKLCGSMVREAMRKEYEGEGF